MTAAHSDTHTMHADSTVLFGLLSLHHRGVSNVYSDVWHTLGASMPVYVAPGGTWKPSVNNLKWWIRASIEFYTTDERDLISS